MRILIAGLLGAIAMFIWTAIAHMATPLATIGFQQIPKEAQVVQAMEASSPTKPGLYIIPWVDPKDSQAMQKSAELMKTEGSAIMVYAPPRTGGNPASMSPMLGVEFLKQLTQSLVAAYLVSMMVGLSFAGRLGAVTLTGVIAGIATNVSYWNWYSFPPDYTLAQIVIEVVSAFVSGLAIAWWLGRKPA